MVVYNSNSDCITYSLAVLHRLVIHPSLNMSVPSMFAASSSSSSSRSVSVIDLLSDDDLDPPASPTDDNLSANPFDITPTSNHSFPSYQALRHFVEEHAAQRGFSIRYPSNSGAPDREDHSGTARCWCFIKPPTALKVEEQQQPSHRPLRNIMPRAANRSGNQVKCACQWRINFSRHANGTYVITPTRHLLHTGHQCVRPERLASTIDSLLVMPAAIVRDTEIAVRHGQRGMETVAASMRARAAPLALRFAVPTVAPELHPDVHISDMQMTNHRKRARGRGEDKRQKSAYETASALSASQSM